MKITSGTRLKNRYEIISLIGSGGFGNTYKAVDNLVNRFVAIKVSENDLSHEAKILKALNSVPHVSHMYDYFTEKNMHFLVMRLVNGKSLLTYQKENGGMISANDIKRLLPSALITLDQMHKLGIIHRDISPGNYIITDDDDLYLIDYGTATALKQNSLFNSLIFKHKGLDAPEYNDINKQGPWTDIYSLCATVIYLLTGEGIPTAQDRQKYDVLPSILLKSNLSTKMQNALLKGVATDSNKRYRSIQEFAKDFFGREEDEIREYYSVHYHARTDIGSRPVNEDNFMVDSLFSYAGEDCEIKGYIDCRQDEIHVVALADGVASSNYGDFASKAAIQAVSHFLDSYKYSSELPRNLVENFLNQVNEKIITLGEKIGKTATTITIFLWRNNDFFVANIGDSPAFHLSRGKLKQLTTAHTVINEKLQKGEMVSASDLHSITAYLGKKNIAGCEMASYMTGTISKGDIFLICSDGISEMLTESQKKNYMKKDGYKAIEEIFKAAHKNRNMDNCTAIILKF